MSSTCSDAGLPAAALALLLTSTSCVTVAPPVHARPALELPADVQARYELRGEVRELAFVAVGDDDGTRYWRGRLATDGETAEIHFALPDGDHVRPFILLVPILAGGRDLMWFLAAELAARGFAVGWTERVSSALKPGQSSAELERIFRRTVIHNRMLVDWAQRHPAVDAERLGCIGVSMGGMIGTVLLAVEPRLRAGALVLAGGDLPSLLADSAETRAIRWREWRLAEHGLQGGELRRELRRELISDPALLGPFVPTDRVLLVHGGLDAVVPCKNQDILWESLGRPKRLVVPLSHFTAALAIQPILNAASDFLHDRIGAASPARPQRF